MISQYKRDKLATELATEWGLALLYRPPALVLAWLLSHTGIRPNAVTITGGLLLPAMIAVAALQEPHNAMLSVTGLAITFLILDCVDGSLARLGGTTSQLGGYLDFAFDMLFRMTAFSCYGWILQKEGVIGLAGLEPFALTMIAAWIALFARVCRDYVSIQRPQTATSSSRSWSTVDWLAAGLSGLDMLFPLIALITWLAGMAHVFVIWIVLLAILDLLETQRGNFKRLLQ